MDCGLDGAWSGELETCAASNGLNFPVYIFAKNQLALGYNVHIDQPPWCLWLSGNPGSNHHEWMSPKETITIEDTFIIVVCANNKNVEAAPADRRLHPHGAPAVHANRPAP